MPRQCQLTGKKPKTGYTYVTRGIAKKKKGIGLKVTGKTRRIFSPNLIQKRYWFAEENRFITLRLSSQAMRTIEKNGLASVVREIRKQGQKV